MNHCRCTVFAAVIASVPISVLGSILPSRIDQTFFVAPSGNDTWSGRLAAPNTCAIRRAVRHIHSRNAVRTARQNAKSGGVQVVIRGGKYFLPETFVLDDRDSGAADCRTSGEPSRTRNRYSAGVRGSSAGGRITIEFLWPT